MTQTGWFVVLGPSNKRVAACVYAQQARRRSLPTISESMFNWLRRKRMVQTAWSAGAYLTKDRIVIHSMSRTRNNVGWYNQPVFAIPHQASNDIIGERLREALKASTWDSQEDDSADKNHPILREAGARTLQRLHVKFGPAYDTGAESVIIDAIIDPSTKGNGCWSWDDFSTWKIATFSPDVYQHFTLLEEYGTGHGG